MLIKAESGVARGRLDWIMVGSLLGLIIIGSVSVLSAASPLPFYTVLIKRHFMALALGIVAFLVGMGLNYQVFEDQAKFLYAGALALLVAVLFVGASAHGQRAWFRLPGFAFQPSEIARIVVILVLASYLDRNNNRIHQLSTILKAAAFIVLPVLVLILKQPDFSATLIIMPMVLGMFFVAGVNLTHLLSLAGFGLMTLGLPMFWILLSVHPEWREASRTAAYFQSISTPGLPLAAALAAIGLLALFAWRLALWMRTPVHWIYFATTALVLAGGVCSGVLVNHQLKDYQRKRFMSFLAPEVDPQGASYNVSQALVAIGSGGMIGKGIFQGTQSQLGFLPERHTDFMFAVIGEEMGFAGAATVILLYLTLIWRVVNAARLSRDRYGFLVCSGIASMLSAYLCINVGMCLGLSPVAGVPLPLLSYGGSNHVIMLWTMGIVANVYSRHYAFI